MPALLAPDYAEQCLWQAQAQPPHPTGGEFPREAHTVVIGAGLCGLAAADTIAQQGEPVAVVEKEALGWGASSRNGGMVIPELKAGPAKLAKKYGPLGTRMYAEVNEAFDFVESAAHGADGRGGIDCDYRRTGELHLAHSPRHVEELREEVWQREEIGEEARFVPRAELPSEIGSDAFFGAALYDRTGSLHPARFHAGWARRALDSGAAIHDRTAATGVERWRGGFRVPTTRGPITAEHVIVATNAYADEAIPWLARRVLPIGSYIIATEVLDESLAESVSPRGRMMVDSKKLLFYWRLTPDRRVAFGGRGTLDPLDVPRARDYLYGEMLRIHPQLEGSTIQFAWGGNVAMTLDRMPHVGRIEGAWYATGCNGSGVALNTWLGHRLGLTVTGQEPPPAVGDLTHRAIPARGLSPAYLPWVSRWLQLQDSR